MVMNPPPRIFRSNYEIRAIRKPVGKDFRSHENAFKRGNDITIFGNSMVSLKEEERKRKKEIQIFKKTPTTGIIGINRCG